MGARADKLRAELLEWTASWRTVHCNNPGVCGWGQHVLDCPITKNEDDGRALVDALAIAEAEERVRAETPPAPAPPCCACPVERHAYNGCANCGCCMPWWQHPDRDSDRSESAHPARIAELERLRARVVELDVFYAAMDGISEGTPLQLTERLTAERDKLKDKLRQRNEALANLNHYIGWNATDACSGEDTCWCSAHAKDRGDAPSLRALLVRACDNLETEGLDECASEIRKAADLWR